MRPFPQFLALSTQYPNAISQLKETLLEPILITTVALFWLAALSIGAVFSATVALYDRMATLNSTALRLPQLRGHTATSPLLLRRKGFVRWHEGSRASSGNQVVRAWEKSTSAPGSSAES